VNCDDEPETIHLVEGFEDGLSLVMAGVKNVWVLWGIGRLRHLERDLFPLSVKTIIVVRDDDGDNPKPDAEHSLWRGEAQNGAGFPIVRPTVSRAHPFHRGLGAVRHEASGLKGKSLSPRIRRPRDHLAVAARPCRLDPANYAVSRLQVTIGEIQFDGRLLVREAPLDRRLDFSGAPGVFLFALLGSLLIEIIPGKPPFTWMLGQPFAREPHCRGRVNLVQIHNEGQRPMPARLRLKVPPQRAGMNNWTAVYAVTPAAILFTEGTELVLGHLD
jgi:hypothetical protein